MNDDSKISSIEEAELIARGGKYDEAEEPIAESVVEPIAEVEPKPKMEAPAVALKQASVQKACVKPTNMIRIGILLSAVLVLQLFAGSKMVRVFVARFVSSPRLANLITAVGVVLIAAILTWITFKI